MFSNALLKLCYSNYIHNPIGTYLLDENFLTTHGKSLDYDSFVRVLIKLYRKIDPDKVESYLKNLYLYISQEHINRSLTEKGYYSLVEPIIVKRSKFLYSIYNSNKYTELSDTEAISIVRVSTKFLYAIPVIADIAPDYVMEFVNIAPSLVPEQSQLYVFIHHGDNSNILINKIKEQLV